MVLINTNVLTAKRTFTVPVGIFISSLTKTNQIKYIGSTNGQYISAENLILGMYKFTLSSVS
jgi:hypothetical protein